MARINSVKLLDAVITTGAGQRHQPVSLDRSFHASGSTSAGVGSATVKVQVSNNGTNWIDLATFTLTLSTTIVDEGYAASAAWKYVRGNCTAISGTDATVTLEMGS